MKTRILLMLLAMLGMMFLFPAPLHAVPTGQGQQLFFDDFSTSQLSPNWNLFSLLQPLVFAPGNLTQNGGWLSLSEPRSLFAGPGCFGGRCPVGANYITANNIQPLVTGATTNQFLYMVWRVVPFNFTQLGNNPGSSSIIRNGGVMLGLISVNELGFGFELGESDISTPPAAGMPLVGQRQAVTVFFDSPMGTPMPCYVSNDGVAAYFLPININGANCSSSASAIVYSNPTAPIDLNTVHLFTIEASLKTDGTSWAAFKVDDNAWLNMTQTACQCIESAGHTYQTMYPFIDAGYCPGVPSNYCQQSTPNQSLGTLVNYVLVDNYVPSTLPAGSPVPSTTINPINNPSATPLNPFNGINPSNLWQSFAVEIGKGVPTGTDQFLISPFYFGGAVLYAITVVALLLATIFTPFDSMKNPFIVSLLLFFDSIANFVLGTLSIWIFAGVVVFFIAVMVGTVPSTIGGKQQG